MSSRFEDPRASALLDVHTALPQESLTSHKSARNLADSKERLVLARLRFGQVLQYQRQEKISGLEWKTTRYCGYTIEAASVIALLEPLLTDLDILRSQKSSVLNFLDQIQRYFQCWGYEAAASDLCWYTTTWEAAKQQLEKAEWIEFMYLDEVVKMYWLNGDISEQSEIAFVIAGFYCYPSEVVEITLSNQRPAE